MTLVKDTSRARGVYADVITTRALEEIARYHYIGAAAKQVDALIKASDLINKISDTFAEFGPNRNVKKSEIEDVQKELRSVLEPREEPIPITPSDRFKITALKELLTPIYARASKIILSQVSHQEDESSLENFTQTLDSIIREVVRAPEVTGKAAAEQLVRRVIQETPILGRDKGNGTFTAVRA